MKLKIILLGIALISLSACGNNNIETTSNTTKSASNAKVSDVVNIKGENNSNQSQNSKEIVKSDNKKSDNETTNENNLAKSDEDNNQTNEQKVKIEEIKKEYDKRLKNLQSMGTTKLDKIKILANANCEGVCNLDMKDQLSKIELHQAQVCYKQCINLQKKAKKELEEYEKKLKQEKAQYPAKCFQDAKQRYQKMLEMMKQDKQEHNLPKIDEKQFIQSDAENCLLIYGYTNYDCEKIKQYTGAYQKCKRIMQLQQDLQFIDMWKYKSFDDYLQQINRGF